MTDDPDADAEADDPADSTPPSEDATEPTDGDEPGDAEATVEAADGGTDERDNGNGNGDDTVPHVELDLYELSVRVSGQSSDELDDVEASATRLMDYLVDHAKELEDQPDSRGLS
ncbi:hypothetical protein DEQ92_00590 [Haloferax sp. Atlit-6N]|uniref:Uncharacterized protein n=1 Tax=Haloferax gibbonsii (strain ATCC 33959 / DSM 4427 / JCM 8863 / NBRC 102184 / NCIMB 2188 / Ma 2.38) TaxID=1227459 RepID=M0H3Q7_HALGM|nr:MULTISPECIES: hypothetical protein [Haloferax]ELZ77734.1 hypothetical protein C454_14610 [Haloferax gibbonsii ATCC 33959]RDZ55538.1 hypothetical protein C5C07_08495 [Haloferax sp. Atlit-4N]REA04811.1 hypothetical protein DEQ92_00590 [Haloferax sp. Atlit-6N]